MKLNQKVLLFITLVIICICCQYEHKPDTEKLNEQMQKQQREHDSLAKTFVFDTIKAKGFFIDERDKKEYKTIQIGTQVWMAENLRFETKKGSICLENKTENCDNCGRLYEW